ncbi:MAG: lipid-binding SYLF domain-containing protein [Verrucomicrobiales bacterium]|jgi:lipid-binding SYLF domain-containing protein|nr:lipid-binding SYLF domain-containing protein [Verrucomicrobiales bacterium]
MKKLILASACLLTFTDGVRASSTVSERIAAATEILLARQTSPKPIPQKIINDARGIAIVSVGRGGFIFGGSRGEGVVITRTRGALGPSWSAPIAFTLSGGSFGAQIGYEKINFVFILNSESAIIEFLSNSGVKWNAGTQGAAGPDYAVEHADDEQPAVYVYTQSDGVYGGATVGDSTLRLDHDANRRAYGADFSALNLANGHGQRPAAAAKLYELLNGPAEE